MVIKTLRNIAEIFTWLLAGMFLWGRALTLLEQMEEKQAREGRIPFGPYDFVRYSIAIFAGILADILLGASLIAWLSER